MVVGAFTVETDLAVIGAGPAGIAAALRARTHGRSVSLIDHRPHPGGSLLDFRVRGDLLADPPVSPDALARSCEDAAAKHAAPIRARLDEAGAAYVCGAARFESARDLAISDNTAVPRLHFRRAIIAAGTPGAPSLTQLCEAAQSGRPLRLPAGVPGAVEAAVLLAAAGVRDVTLTGTLAAPAACRENLASELRACGITLCDDDDRAAAATAPAYDAARAGVHVRGDGAIDRVDGVRTNEPRVLAAGAVSGAGHDLRRAILEGRAAGDIASAAPSSLILPSCMVTMLRAPSPLFWCGDDESGADLITAQPDVARDLLIFCEREGGLVRGARTSRADGGGFIDRIAAAIEMGAVLDDLDVLLADW